MGWIADLLSEIPSAAKYKIQLEQLSTENESLKAKLEACEKNLDRANEEIRNLNLVINGLKNKDQKKYEAATEKVLMAFFNKSREFSANDIASGITMEVGIVDHYIKLLEKDGLIEQSSGSVPPKFEITFKGSEYVMNNLIT
ncbi:MAG: hypothetical protein PVG39_30355 [Desulfobacteraceae bacterium]|jgi:predicted transcriptional regulator